MSFSSLNSLLSNRIPKPQKRSAAEWRKLWIELDQLGVSDEAIQAAEPQLISLLEQERICGACRGYPLCGKLGDAKGMRDQLDCHAGNVQLKTGYCAPFLEHQAIRRAARFSTYSIRGERERRLSFSNFPQEQQQRKPKLFEAAQTFALTYRTGDEAKGIYIFGPAGVGKTHLLHAILNKLEERRIPSIFVQAESLFDRLRSAIGRDEELEPILDAFSSVPVLAIDELGHERANEFTLEKMFRIINQRFVRNLPTFFTSNFEPPALYHRLSNDLLPLIDPLRSRIIGMTKLAYLDGEDHRIATMDVLEM